MTQPPYLIMVAIAAPFVLFALTLAWADWYSRNARRSNEACPAETHDSPVDYREAA